MGRAGGIPQMAILKDVTIGDCRLILGDCLEVMPGLAKVDAVVTDPPYALEDWNTRGTNAARGQGRSWKGPGKNKGGHECAEWDKPLKAEHFEAIFNGSKHQIIWGGNYLLDHLPRTKQMFVWNKYIRGMHYNDCEIAWTSQWREACRVFDYSPSAAEPKQHPTQKPLALMEWCIGRLPDECETILDPFMGSGTTLVACAKMGRKGIGIELDPGYFEAACKRVCDAYAQPDLFIAPPKKPVQEALF
jgi:DNA modification methylase